VSSTDFRTTNLVDVFWTVTVINKHRLPPMLLMTPRIPPPAHRRVRRSRGGWTQIFGGKASLPVEKARNFTTSPAFGAAIGGDSVVISQRCFATEN